MTVSPPVLQECVTSPWLSHFATEPERRVFDPRVKIDKRNVDLQSLDSSGSAGGGEEPGGQVPHQRNHAEY